MLGNDNNLPVVEPQDPPGTILGLISADISAQDLIDRCMNDKAFSLQCAENDQTLWTYLLQRDYPQWGVIGNPKEYYARIAKVYGLHLNTTTTSINISGQELLRQQLEANPGRLTLQIRVAGTEPFPVADVVARTYSGALTQVLDNLQRYNVTDPKQWIFQLNTEDLGVEHLSSDWPQLFRGSLLKILSNNRLDQVVVQTTRGQEIEAELIAAFDLLQCQAGLCDVLTQTIVARLKRQADEVAQGNVVIEPVRLVRVEFGVAPGAVVYYFQTLSNLLFLNDAFTEEIIEYYRDLIRLIPGIKLSLLPRGYPFIKRDNLDRFDAKLFHVDPLTQPNVFPDYLNAPVFGEIDTSDPVFEMWRAAEKPYPIITQYPQAPVISQRMETVLPGIVSVIQILKQRLSEAFPNREAGFIVAGGMFSIIFDDYLSTQTNWLLKTDVDFFVYGKTHELRVQAFEIIMPILSTEYPLGPTNRHKRQAEMPAAQYIIGGKPVMAYTVMKSVVTAQRYEYLDKDFKPVGYNVPNPNLGVSGDRARRLDQHERSVAFQVVNTNSKDGFEVIMNFDTSHIQVGYDCYDGWIATPYWELYYPRREALLVRYNMRGGRFTKALYRGFTLKTLLPYALLLKMTGEDYASVIRPDRKIVFKPQPQNGKYPFPDDLKAPRRRDFSHRPIIAKRIVTKNVEIIATGDDSELENPVRIASRRYNQIDGDYRLIYNVVKSLDEIFERIKYDGQFKNGFDGYVNSAYLTFKIAPLPSERHLGYNRLSKFLLRDARLVSDPRNVPIEFPMPGTEMFKWSFMTDVLVHAKALMPIHNYGLYRESRSMGMPLSIASIMSAPANKLTQTAKIQNVLVLRSRDDYMHYAMGRTMPPTRREEPVRIGRKLGRGYNQEVIVGDPTTPPRKNLSLVVKAVERVNFPDPEVFRLNPTSGAEHETIKLPKATKKELIHRVFNFPVVIEGVVSFQSDEDFDALDLHAPMLTDEAREQLPRLTYEQFTQIASGEMILDIGLTGFQYLVEFPASVSESIFLDECDWTMPLDEVLGNRDLRFNSICIFGAPIIAAQGSADELPVEIKPAAGDEAFFANPPSQLKIFRSFKIIN